MTLKRRDLLENPEYAGNLTAEQMLEACLAAGYDEASSQKAARLRGEARLAQGLEP